MVGWAVPGKKSVHCRPSSPSHGLEKNLYTDPEFHTSKAVDPQIQTSRARIAEQAQQAGFWSTGLRNN
jgi:hypothetical protein